MGKWISRLQVSFLEFLIKFCYFWWKFLGIFTPSSFPWMQTFRWNVRMFPVIKQILDWVRSGHISLKKLHTKHIQEYANKTEPVGQDPWECICWRWSKFLRKAHAPVMMLWTWLIQDLVRVIWQLALGKSLVAMIWNVHPVLETSKCQKGAWFYWFS